MNINRTEQAITQDSTVQQNSETQNVHACRPQALVRPNVTKRFTGWPLFFKKDFPWLLHDQKMKIMTYRHNIFFQINDTTTYECTPELVVTVPAACTSLCQQDKTTAVCIYTYLLIFHNSLSNTTSFAVPQNPWPIFHDFPWPLLFSMIFQAWKMVFLNSRTFHDFPGPVVTLGSAGALGFTSTRFTTMPERMYKQNSTRLALQSHSKIAKPHLFVQSSHILYTSNKHKVKLSDKWKSATIGYCAKESS